MCVSVDTRFYSEHYVLYNTALCRYFIEALKLIYIIYNYMAYTVFNSHYQFFFCLVVAVEVYPVHRESSFDGSVQLAAGYYICSESLLSCKFTSVKRTKCLVGIKYKTVSVIILVYCVFIHTAVFTYKIFIHNVKRSTVFFRKLNCVVLSDHEMILIVYR